MAPPKISPGMLPTERQMRQKKNEFMCRNLKVNITGRHGKYFGLGLVQYVTKTIASNKQLFYVLSTDM